MAEIVKSSPEPFFRGPKCILFETLARARESPQVLAIKGQETKNAGRMTSRRFRELVGNLNFEVFHKAPRVIRLENHCFIDRGVWQVKKLRRGQVVELTPWITLISPSPTPSASQSVKRDPLALALLYQSLLDAGLAKSRAEVARYFGVSRARVTQVLRRLEQ